jgi:RNA polymerase sigma-70 factor (ECF subfamily)
MDDFERLAQWRSGDAAAGNLLFERHFESVYRFFRHKVGADALDLVQKTFLVCVESRDRFRAQSSFRTYLFAIARNQLFAYWRAAARAPDLDEGSTSLHELSPSPSAIALKRHEDRRLLEALRTIPLELQVILELFYWEELSGAEVAEVLGVPEGTARSRLRRACKALVDRLQALEPIGDLPATATDFDTWADSLRRLGVELLQD